jgi:hypothetical protein
VEHYIKFMRRLLDDAESQIKRLESGNFRIFEYVHGGPGIERTAEQIAILKKQVL